MGAGVTKRRAVFVDRDGTLNTQTIRGGKPYSPERVEDFHLFPGVPEACRALKAAGFALVVATNQPDVGRGVISMSLIEAMHARLLELIPEIERIEVCYDSGLDGPSRRRKPEPGMLLDAAAAMNLDLAGSWMIGDRWRDVNCGNAAGVRTVFIDFGYAEKLDKAPNFTARSFQEAASIVLQNAGTA
jgi:D-glycero-D-manno-heptose 1,7-bisphosphate phosphatase